MQSFILLQDNQLQSKIDRLSQLRFYHQCIDFSRASVRSQNHPDRNQWMTNLVHAQGLQS